MSPEKRLSICIPTYNRPAWFQRGLASIVGDPQVDRSQVEIVITDDSDDARCGAIANATLTGWHYRYEHHPQALGMAQNWNRAIQLARGQFVMVLHDDDFFLPGGVERLVNAIQKIGDRYPVLLCGVQVVDQQERILKQQVFQSRQFLPPHDALMRLFSNSSFVRFPAIVIKRSIFDAVGLFNPDWKEPCDVEMWMRLFSQYGVYCHQAVTVAYRVHSQALTMASFNQQTIGILLGLFDELSRFNVLSKKELIACKQLFFYQYILAGAWRQLRRRNGQAFCQIMQLFNLSEIKTLNPPLKWLILRIAFGVINQAYKIYYPRNFD